MKTETGLWVDHYNTVVVIVSDEGEEGKEITSHMEKHMRYFNDTSKGRTSEDVLNRQFEHYLKSRYDAENDVVRDEDAV
jgi:hypothetical protein